jgi:hypothetical protein
MSPIGSAIFGILSVATNVTNIIEDEITPERIHQGLRVYPGIVYQVIADKTDITYSGPSGLETATLVVVCMSDSGDGSGGGYSQVQSMKMAVQTALDGYPIAQSASNIVNGIEIEGIFMEGYHEGSFETAAAAEIDLINYGEFQFQIVFQNS